MPDQMLKTTSVPAALLQTMQAGIMNWHYRGRPTWKCPLDIAIYLDVLWTLQPATIVEFAISSGHFHVGRPR